MLKPTLPDDASMALTRRLDALLELARVSRSQPLEVVLESVVEVVERVVGFLGVVVNIYRPAWDDFEVVLVRGNADTREALLHTVDSREGWAAGLHPDVERVPGAFFIAEENVEAWNRFSPDSSFFPPFEPRTDVDDPWKGEDGVFVEMRSSTGEVLGILSLDNPRSGERPTDGDLELLVAVTAHASLALEAAQSAEEAERHQLALAGLLDISSSLVSETTENGVLQQICTGAVSTLGFETVAVYLAAGSSARLRAGLGRPAPSEPIALAPLLELLHSHTDHGAALIERASLLPHAAPSRRNGSGPRAWNDHWLLVPLMKGDDELLGVLLFDDPSDRLLPDDDRRQTLRLLADHTVAALASIHRQTRLEYLASHDPLTGVRNRRDLLHAIERLTARHDMVSVLMCDLDHFKEVNDRFGHATGDRVLERFGAVLREHARADDILVRTGGEEFCIVLPRVNGHGAMLAAERLRKATPHAMEDIVASLTVSIGIATSRPGARDATKLLAAADRALYAAKVAGRNQSHTAGAFAA